MPLKKLTTEEQASTEALLGAIERKDRRFRIFQSLFMAVVFVALIIVIAAQQRTLAEVHDQQIQAEKVAIDTAKRSQDQQDKIIRRLNCMVVFFAQKDRSNLSIDNIDQCTLNRDESVDQFFAKPEQTPAEQPPNLQGSTQSVPRNNDRVQSPTPNTSTGEDEQNDEDGGTNEQRPPLAIDLPLLPPIPVCVPLVDVCVTR